MKAGVDKSDARVRAGFLGAPERGRVTEEMVSTYFLIVNRKCSSFKKYTCQFIQNDTELANNCKNRTTPNFEVP